MTVSISRRIVRRNQLAPRCTGEFVVHPTYHAGASFSVFVERAPHRSRNRLGRGPAAGGVAVDRVQVERFRGFHEGAVEIDQTVAHFFAGLDENGLVLPRIRIALLHLPLVRPHAALREYAELRLKNAASLEEEFASQFVLKS